MHGKPTGGITILEASSCHPLPTVKSVATGIILEPRNSCVRDICIKEFKEPVGAAGMDSDKVIFIGVTRFIRHQFGAKMWGSQCLIGYKRSLHCTGWQEQATFV